MKEKMRPSDQHQEVSSLEKELILFNDDVNTFDHVIETLIEVCGHDHLQAEQCAWIAHFNGKCSVMNGTFESLKPIHDEMTQRELTVSIT